MDRPFLVLDDVRALSCADDGEADFQVASLSALLGGRRLTPMVRVTSDSFHCSQFDQLVASSTAFGRLFYGQRPPRGELRAYHRALDEQLSQARKKFGRRNVERSVEFQSFLTAANALLAHLERWADDDDGPTTVRVTPY